MFSITEIFTCIIDRKQLDVYSDLIYGIEINTLVQSFVCLFFFLNNFPTCDLCLCSVQEITGALALTGQKFR